MWEVYRSRWFNIRKFNNSTYSQCTREKSNRHCNRSRNLSFFSYFLETHKILNTRELLQVHNSIDRSHSRHHVGMISKMKVSKHLQFQIHTEVDMVWLRVSTIPLKNISLASTHSLSNLVLCSVWHVLGAQQIFWKN